jgi:hypothetical protein
MAIRTIRVIARVEAVSAETTPSEPGIMMGDLIYYVAWDDETSVLDSGLLSFEGSSQASLFAPDIAKRVLRKAASALDN